LAPWPDGNETPPSVKKEGSLVRGCERPRISFMLATRQIIPNTPPAPSTTGRQERCQYARCRATTARTGRATAREATVSGHKMRNVLISSSNGRGSVLITTSIGCSAPADRTVSVTRTTANRIAILSDASPQAISLVLGHSTTPDRLG